MKIRIVYWTFGRNTEKVSENTECAKLHITTISNDSIENYHCMINSVKKVLEKSYE